MRLKSEIWVKAFVRGCSSAGAGAFVVRRGDADAGTILIRINRLDGTSQLFAPAYAGHEEAYTDRRWQTAFAAGWVEDARIDERLEREIRLDPDCWIVEVEDREGRTFLDAWVLKS